MRPALLIDILVCLQGSVQVPPLLWRLAWPPRAEACSLRVSEGVPDCGQAPPAAEQDGLPFSWLSVCRFPLGELQPSSGPWAGGPQRSAGARAAGPRGIAEAALHDSGSWQLMASERS